MKLKGDLDSIGLADLFQTLASQRATGVLSVTAPSGQKTIALASGEIAVVSDKLSERSRLGDLLIARGRLGEDQLTEALKEQRNSEQRLRLGDLLIKLNFIRPEDIEDSLRFQFEEELFDLFTWKNATFEFDGERSIDDACTELETGNLQRMHIDPQAVIAEAGRRMAEWKEVENRLPTPYLCFKLTPKGEEFATRANNATQQIIKLLKEGRTIETTVKRSCMGRFNVCKSIMKLLDEGWIFPYPATELRILASEHRAQNRFSDAMYIYRRLLDSAQTDEERAELESQIEDTLQAIREASEAGESPEGVDTVSYKEAAEKFKSRQRMKRIGALVFSGAMLIVATVYLTDAYRPPPRLSEDYQEAIKAADEAVKLNKYEEAARIWEKFLLKIKDKNSPTAQLVEERLRNLPLQSTAHVDRLLQPVEALERAGKLDDAEAGFNRLLLQFPDHSQNQRMKDGLARIDERRKQAAVENKQTELRRKVDAALEMFQERKYTSARRAYQQILESAPSDAPERAACEKGLTLLNEIERRAQASYEAGEEELKQKKAEKAIATFETAASEWPDCEPAKSALLKSQRLKRRLEQLKQDFADSEAAESRRGLIQAMENFKQIEREYAEFETVDIVRKRIFELSRKITAVDNRIEQATALMTEGDKVRARRMFGELIKEHPGILTLRKVEVPVNVVSYPEGASILIDGKAVGVTPLEIKLPVALPFTIRLERPGYEASERRIERLTDELELPASLGRLKREPVRALMLKPSILAAPALIKDELYVYHGNSLSVLDPKGSSTRWSLPNLFDVSMDSRPNPSGIGPAQFISDKSFWYPRWQAIQTSSSKFLLSLRSRELLEIDSEKHSFRQLLKLPAEPVGQMHLERQSLLNGRPLLAIAFLDGKVRVYDFEKLASGTLWEQAGDPNVAAPAGAIVTGPAPRPNGTILTLAANGRLRSFAMVNGQESWTMELGFPVLEDSVLPQSPNESVAAFVHTNGRVSAVDLTTHTKLWELPVAKAMDEASSAVVGNDGVYVIARDGIVRKFSRERATEKPVQIWQRPIDGSSEIPLFLGNNLYAVSHFGTIYAISPANGSVLWDYRTEGKPTHVIEHGKLLYVATSEGRLLILNVE